MSEVITGAIIESSENITYTENIKKSCALFDSVEGFIENLQKDYNGVNVYLQDLKVLKKRGFKVDNSIARLEFQLEQTAVSIEALGKQKVNRLQLLKIDIIELSEMVLRDRLIIDDKEQERINAFHRELEEYKLKTGVITILDIDKLVTISLNHMRDLLSDVGKFDPQIEEAKKYKERNYDIGDLINDLLSQKENLKKSYDMFITRFAQLSVKHLLRTENYIEDIKNEAQKIKDAPKEDEKKTKSVEDSESKDSEVKDSKVKDSEVKDSEVKES